MNKITEYKKWGNYTSTIGYADTLLEAVEKYKAEMIGEGDWSHE